VEFFPSFTNETDLTDLAEISFHKVKMSWPQYLQNLSLSKIHTFHIRPAVFSWTIADVKFLHLNKGRLCVVCRNVFLDADWLKEKLKFYKY
jgi:hypothetical protein